MPPPATTEPAGEAAPAERQVALLWRKVAPIGSRPTPRRRGNCTKGVGFLDTEAVAARAAAARAPARPNILCAWLAQGRQRQWEQREE
mmetsp:Transcript_26172/g.73210  ORF Transcript_26172/g.73210 Transcript_26172/m.73210 type:complete len:88 (-) Transcript_26172:47-310(-)